MKRRLFLFAAPAIVAAPSLMRVSTLPTELEVFSVNVPVSIEPLGTYVRYSGFNIILTPDLPRIDRTAWSWWKNSAVCTKALTS